MLEKEHREIKRLVWGYRGQVDWNIYRAWKIQAVGMFDSKELN